MQPVEPEIAEATETGQPSHGKFMVNLASLTALLGIVNYAYYIAFKVPGSVALFQSLRIDLPLPTRFFLALAQSVPLLLLVVAVNVLCIALAWKRASRSLAVATAVLSLLFGYAAVESINLPLKKIQQALNKQ